MADQAPSTAPLVEEIVALRRRIAELEAQVNEMDRQRQALVEREAGFRRILNQAAAGYFFVDLDLHIAQVNRAWLQMHKYESAEEIVGQPLSMILLEDSQADIERYAQHLLTGATIPAADLPVRCKDGSIGYVTFSAHPVIQQGKVVGLEGFSIDITERKHAEEQVRRVTRALRALSQCNRALVRAEYEAGLLEDICRILVATAGYRAAWTALPGELDQRVVPAAQCGFEDGFLESLGITWDETEYGRGIVGTVLRTRKTVVVQDALADPRLNPWRAMIVCAGIASCAALPLLSGEELLGALTIYAPEPDAFDSAELELITDLADNLAYGISSLRIRETHRRTQEALAESKQQLEQRVLARTAELAAANERLREEVAERSRIEEALRQEQQRLRQLLEVYEQHRQLIAYDIHDTVCQRLTGALMTFEGCARILQPHCAEATREGFSRVVQLLQEGLREARRLMSGLRPLILDESGLIAAIDYLVCENQGVDGLEIVFQHDVQFERLAPPLETAIFRIIQEGLTNSQRHSNSRVVRIGLVQQGGLIQVDIEDWGRGFDPNRVQQNRFGLEGMRERAQLFDGTFRIDSQPGHGTWIRVELPLVEGGFEKP